MYRRKNVVITIMCVFIVFMAIGYAAFSTILTIDGTAEISSTWDVHFSSMTAGTAVGNATNRSAPTFTDKTATMDVNLDVPGDSMTYKLTITNSGTLNAIIEDVSAEATGSTAIIYTMSGIKKGDKIAVGERIEITIKIEYDKTVTSQPIDTTKILTVAINAVQDVGQNINIEEPIINNNVVLLSRTESSTITPKLIVDWSELSKIEFTGRTTSTDKNILLATHSGQYIALNGEWVFSGLSATADMNYTDFADGNLNTVTFNITDGGTSREYITIGLDNVWNKALDIREIKFYNKNNELILHILADASGKFYNTLNNSYLDNYLSPSNLTVVSTLYPVVKGN